MAQMVIPGESFAKNPSSFNGRKVSIKNIQLDFSNKMAAPTGAVAPVGSAGMGAGSVGPGPGGQGVNTTDSAVRLTHIPTGIVVSCQNERSQLQNKATAMAVLQAKILERTRQEEQAKINALKGDTSGSWGNQMRSYVLHPYQMVKDIRTEVETGNTSAVLDGDIDQFVEAGIRWRREQSN